MKKISFDVIIADTFYFPADDKKTLLHLWPLASGTRELESVDLEFEPSSGNEMNDAFAALDEYMKKNHPNKDYKIYYWWWKR